MSPWSRSSGSRYAFQEPTNASTPTVTRPGTDSGRIMVEKIRIRLAPSIWAASSISFGMAWRNGRRITMVMGSANAACGSATPHHVLLI